MKASFEIGILKITLLLILFLSFIPAAFSQTNFQGGLNFALGLPQGEFNDKVNENGYGLGGNFFYSPSSSLLGIGISMGYMNYGSESRREPFSSTIPDVFVKVTTTNNIVQGHLILRAQTKRGTIHPYLDGLVGFNYLFTETKIEDEDNGGEEIASSTNFDDAVFSYGIGGGLATNLYTSPAGKKWSISLDLGAHYVLGGEAEYLKKGSIRRENGSVVYDIIKSNTDLLVTHIGVVFEF